MSKIVDINWLYLKYYSDNPQLRRIVTVHSKQVAKKALEIAAKKNLPLDFKDIYVAAMLHDIGVVRCKANDIHAFGDLPYLQHGIEGKKILEGHGLYKFANICVTHTGAGISAAEIRKNNLPLPEKDMIPKTLLEKLICYADKFYSKSHDLTKEKSIEEVINQMKKFGEGPYKRFMEIHSLFNVEGN
ncbi:MAG: HD domain-containing protein [Muribaculaceae bacterium]|nr:HD domain-containing protein [Muribaculaceae bacterium]